MTDINLAIIGSRSFSDYELAKEFINQTVKENDLNIIKIISGGARGADSIGEYYAQEYNIPVQIFKPDWSIGKHAGMLRNTDIIKSSDCVIAFWDGQSNGTRDSINKANRFGKRVIVKTV